MDYSDVHQSELQDLYLCENKLGGLQCCIPVYVKEYFVGYSVVYQSAL